MNAYGTFRTTPQASRGSSRPLTTRRSPHGALPEGEHARPLRWRRPRTPQNGDWASTFAMQCAKPLRTAPRKIARGDVWKTSTWRTAAFTRWRSPARAS